ncbi:MAG: carboxypeptidase regulatory-like domain-containing protein, partial [Promethearchaeota archaeon]
MSFWQKIVSDLSFLRVQIIPLRKLRLFMTAIFLVAVINGASASFFLGVSRDDFFYETDAETLIISDERAATPITGRISSSLIGILRGIPGVESVSPEILSLCVINQNDQPVVVRGITETFRDIISSLTIQSGDWLFNDTVGSRAVIIGQTLSEKLDLQVGQSILLSSAMLDEIISVRIVGVFETKRSFDEEILASLEFGRTLEGLNSNDVNIARVKIDTKVTTKAEVKEFVSSLSNNAVVTGYISDDYNQPVSRARILAFLKGDLVREVLSNKNGYYAIQLTPGNYRFVIYKPSTHESFVFGNKTLEPGARRSWDFELKRKKASVQGRVIDSFLFLPINGSSVYLKNAINETVEEAQTNAKGYFTFTDVPFGDQFFLECNHPDYFQVPTSFSSFKFLQDDEGSTEIKISQRNLYLTPRPSNVSGYLTAWESGQPIMNALITLKNPDYNYTTLSDNRGRYTFLGITEGNYSIIISHPSYAPKHESFFLGSNIHLVLNNSLYPSFPLFSGINTLLGHIKGFQNQSLADAFIELRLASNNSWVASTLALPDGTFMFEGVADLAYKITIFDLNYWSKTINFDFGGNQNGFIDVTLNLRLSSLICYVVNEYTQELVENTTISLYYNDELRTQIFSTGEHTFADLLPGKYTIDVQQEDFESSNQTFQVSIN